MSLELWNQIRLNEDEYGPFYRSYLDKLDSGNVLDTLKKQQTILSGVIPSLKPEQALYRYAEGKWTVKQVIGHLIDSERVFAYRALCFSRNEQTSLPGFDQDAYVEHAAFNERALESLAREYEAQREANIQLFLSFAEPVLSRKGIANDNPMSVRAIPHIIAGHERHHLEILHSKYNLDLDLG